MVGFHSPQNQLMLKHRSIGASKTTPPSIGMVSRWTRPLLVTVRGAGGAVDASAPLRTGGATVRTTCLNTGATATTTASLLPPASRSSGPPRLFIPVAVAASLTTISTPDPRRPVGSAPDAAIELIGDHLTDAAHLASFSTALGRVPSIVLGPCWSAQAASQQLLQAVLQESSAQVDGTGLLQPSTQVSAASLRQLRLATAHGNALSAPEAVDQLIRMLHTAHPAATEDAVRSILGDQDST